MIALFRAEWNKINGNRWATGSLMWVFPILACVFIIFVMLAITFSEVARDSFTTDGIDPWNETFLGTWELVNNELGRWIIAIFTAFVFATEYQHGTWKNLVTRRPRWQIILNKFAVVAAFVLVAWLLMSFIVGVGTGLVAARLGLDYGTVDGPTVRAFIGDYVVQMFITLASTAIATSYAAFAATITNSVTVSAMIAIAINIAETGILVPVAILNWLFDIRLWDIYLFTPSYNLANISTHVTRDRGYSLDFSNEDTGLVDIVGPNSLEVSILIVVLIMVLFISLTVWRFQRQDITV